jgi:hypothetical protein
VAAGDDSKGRSILSPGAICKAKSTIEMNNGMQICAYTTYYATCSLKIIIFNKFEGVFIANIANFIVIKAIFIEYFKIFDKYFGSRLQFILIYTNFVY